MHQYKMSDHASEIENIFIHENKHFSDFNEWGEKLYQSIPYAIREQRAVLIQMGHPSYSRMRASSQQSVIKYGEKYGLYFRGKTELLITTPVTIKQIPIK